MNWYQRNSRDAGEIMWAVSTVIGAVFLVAAIACIAVSITGGSLRATAGISAQHLAIRKCCKRGGVCTVFAK